MPVIPEFANQQSFPIIYRNRVIPNTILRQMFRSKIRTDRKVGNDKYSKSLCSRRRFFSQFKFRDPRPLNFPLLFLISKKVPVVFFHVTDRTFPFYEYRSFLRGGKILNILNQKVSERKRFHVRKQYVDFFRHGLNQMILIFQSAKFVFQKLNLFFLVFRTDSGFERKISRPLVLLRTPRLDDLQLGSFQTVFRKKRFQLSKNIFGQSFTDYSDFDFFSPLFLTTFAERILLLSNEK